MEGHPLDISAVDSTTATTRNAHSLTNLEDRFNKLSLITWALWTLLQETTDLTEEDLLQRFQDLDAVDGSADSRITPQVVNCPKCHRVLSGKHPKCLYCGAVKPILSAFDHLL